MSWFTRALSSTLGRKLIVSLTGLFLITFLIVHASGNLQLLNNDGGESFNKYAKFMTTNPLIKTLSYGLYAGFLIHILWSVLLTFTNRRARPVKYHYEAAGVSSSWASRNMGLLGAVILVFLVIHLRAFWFQMKFGSLPEVTYADGEAYKDLYTLVVTAFKNPVYALFYIGSMIFLGFHLSHGFSSAFQTLGLNHKKYTPLINSVGILISILIPVIFAIQPIYVYLFV
jgi:succinate dehydrogenase / fumarate reductase cytochrome b subunit